MVVGAGDEVSAHLNLAGVAVGGVDHMAIIDHAVLQ